MSFANAEVAESGAGPEMRRVIPMTGGKEDGPEATGGPTGSQCNRTLGENHPQKQADSANGGPPVD